MKYSIEAIKLMSTEKDGVNEVFVCMEVVFVTSAKVKHS